VLLTPAAASAHAVLQSSDPATGATLPNGPARVSLAFNEPVQPILGGIQVFAPSGKEVTAGKAHGEAGHRLVVGLRTGLDQGTYTVTWRVSSADTHPVAGAFTFNIGRASSTAAPVGLGDLSKGASKPLGVTLGVIRWLAFASFALLVGASVLLFACWPEGTGVRRARRIVLGAAGTLAAASAAEVVLFGPYAAAGGFGDLLDLSALGGTVRSRLGVSLLVRLALLAGTGWWLRWLLARLRAADRAERIRMGAVGGVLAAGIAATWAAAGHASTGREVPLALPVDTVHLLAMATWLGGLVLLATALLSGGEAEQMQVAVPRFSRLALVSVSVLVATGSYQTWRQAGGLTALTDTTYGRLLMVKLGIFGGLIGLAYVSRGVVQYWFTRDDDADTVDDPAGAAEDEAEDEGDGVGLLRRIVAAEATVAVGVLALTAVLVNVQPARDAFAAQTVAQGGGAAAVTKSASWDTGSVRGGKGTVTFHMSPARAGSNQVWVEVEDANGKPKRVGNLRFTLTEQSKGIGPLQAQVVPGFEAGQYLARGIEIPFAGSWRVTMFIRTTEVDEAFVTIQVPVG
jgi:copper transport protein